MPEVTMKMVGSIRGKAAFALPIEKFK